jgi:hypothetical protein
VIEMTLQDEWRRACAEAEKEVLMGFEEVAENEKE